MVNWGDEYIKMVFFFFLSIPLLSGVFVVVFIRITYEKVIFSKFLYLFWFIPVIPECSVILKASIACVHTQNMVDE